MGELTFRQVDFGQVVFSRVVASRGEVLPPVRGLALTFRLVNLEKKDNLKFRHDFWRKKVSTEF